jgi:glyoxylase-like metal-dependent hydrolase (beta-lactamase superfamily II)
MLSQTSLEGVGRPFDPRTGVPGLPEWTCIPTPGHSPGHVAFARASNRVLIAGDAVLTVDVSSLRGWLAWGLRRDKPHVYGPPWYTTWDQCATEASVAVLAALAPQVLATGHGALMGGEAVARELRAVAERLARARHAEGPDAAAASAHPARPTGTPCGRDDRAEPRGSRSDRCRPGQDGGR